MHQYIDAPMTTWKLTKLYWLSERKKMAYFYLATLLILTVALVGVNVVFTYWINYFWNALQDFNKDEVFKLAFFFVGLAAVFIVLAVYKFYVQSKFTLRWRQWMTQYIIKAWMHNQSYYYIENFDEGTDNPDQRIQEDVLAFTNLTTSLFLGLFDAVITLCSFLIILWTLSGPMVINLGSYGQFHIPGYLVWIALIYSIIGTYITHLIGKKLVMLNFEKQKQEANFRFNAVRIRNNAENIALYQAEDKEERGILKVFQDVIDITLRVITREKKLLYFTAGFNQVSTVIPLFASLPMYFGKQIKLGGIQQIASAFSHVQSSLSFFVDAYATIAEWRSVVIRLTTFMNKMHDVSEKYAEVKQLDYEEQDKDEISSDGLNLETQTGIKLFENLSITFEKGKSYIIKGPSGIGKSTYIKALSGIWPFVSGLVKIPKNLNVMYIPQRTYLPLGTLRQVLLYPGTLKVPDTKLKKLLKEVGLPQFADQLKVRKNWTEILSLGEQQKISFIRILLAEPDWIFLDESTSSLDKDNEAKLYQMVKEKLPNSSIISVAHRDTVDVFHDEQVMFTSDRKVEITPVMA